MKLKARSYRQSYQRCEKVTHPHSHQKQAGMHSFTLTNTLLVYLCRNLYLHRFRYMSTKRLDDLNYSKLLLYLTPSICGLFIISLFLASHRPANALWKGEENGSYGNGPVRCQFEMSNIVMYCMSLLSQLMSKKQSFQ